MGFIALALGVLAILAAIGFAFLYFAAMAMLIVIGVTYVVSFWVLYALLGPDNATWALMLTIPLGTLGLFAASKLMDK